MRDEGSSRTLDGYKIKGVQRRAGPTTVGRVPRHKVHSSFNLSNKRQFYSSINFTAVSGTETDDKSINTNVSRCNIDRYRLYGHLKMTYMHSAEVNV